MVMNKFAKGDYLNYIPAMPLAILFVAAYIVPVLALAVVSFAESLRFEQWGFSQYVSFFSDSFNWRVLGNTLWLSLKVTLLTMLIAYPLGLFYYEFGSRVRALLLFIILLPMLTSTVVRTFAWIVMLGREGIINTALIKWGITELPLQMLYTPTALMITLSQICLPLMAMPLINSLLRIKQDLVRAAIGLGASRWRVLFSIILPLSIPGLIAGSLLTFSFTSTAFVTHTLVGGGRQLYMPEFIHQQATGLQNLNYGAALSMIFMFSVMGLVALVMLTVSRRLGRFNA